MRVGWVWAAAIMATSAMGQQNSPPPFDDRAEMMRKLGIKTLRGGANPNDQSTFDEATANPYKDSMPDVLRFKSGGEVTKASEWPARRREIAEDFEREVYGRVPRRVPKVTWEVTGVIPGMNGGIPTVTRTLVGHVDNRSYPAVSVNIQASFTVPAHSAEAVPIMIEFGGFAPRRGTGIPWTDQAIAHGWGYGSINPNSIQPDSNRVDLGIIGLCNQGKPRDPEDWGALRAWAWGLSKLIDYFEANRGMRVDPTKVGVEGVSRYGKAAIVAQAFDERVAVGLIGSSGAGGTKLQRHIFGEMLENLAGGAPYWMAGNLMKYGSADPPLTVADLPVDSHELIALCAPRPVFISHGLVEKGDAKWVDAHGSFMAGVLAGPVYRLLGKRDFGTAGNYLTDPMPAVGTLIGGELAWRQHEGGHEVTQNWPAFFDWVSQYVPAPKLPENREAYRVPADQPSPRQDENSLLAHRDLLEKAKKGGIDVYFVGDSITRRWGTSDAAWRKLYDNWKVNFFGWNAGNFGWGGDSTQNILWRLKNGELDGVNPKVIVVLAGTNNLPSGAPAAEIARGIKAILDTCRGKAPGATIILTAIFPRSDDMRYRATIQAVNERLERFADGKRIRFLNVNEGLAGPDGRMFEPVTNDGLHLTVEGYKVWANGLRPLLRELLGPRSKTDHAPPPTGDPSAAKKT